MKKRGKKPRQNTVKERDCEDWCFVCKDGGKLILCDHDDCLKVYHSECVRKDDSLHEAGDHWTCDRHFCLRCHKSPKFYCYCCPNAVCGQCLSATRFAPMRGKNGLCEECLDLVICVEEDDAVDDDGEKIDLENRDTYECLFLEYWDIIKDKEGLTLEDVYSADARLLKGLHSNHRFKSKRICKGKEDREDKAESVTSDSDLDDFGDETMGKRKKALEYTGWGSKPLIEFLRSIGKDTTQVLSQYDVDLIMRDYIKEKNLFDPNKTKKVICDEALYSVFRRKSIHKNRIYGLLEAHFTENVDLSESEAEETVKEVESSSSRKIQKTMASNKKQKSVSADEKSQDKEADVVVQETGFASIVAENIKLVYLRKSLVEQMLNEPESFEAKVVGCFVRVKNNARDYTQKNTHQLLQVTGIKQTSTSGEKGEVLLTVTAVAGIPTDVHFSLLSNLDFCEGEIEELKEKVENGLIPKPLLEELQQKADYLHEEITKHWIERELYVLNGEIGHANILGRRYELGQFLERRAVLENPAEQERLMKTFPKVIPEFAEIKTGPVNLEVDLEVHDGSPKPDSVKKASKSPSP